MPRIGSRKLYHILYPQLQGLVVGRDKLLATLKANHLHLVSNFYSKKIMGYNLSTSLGVEGSIDVLKMAINQKHHRDESLIHHSYRGLQYCSNEYEKTLAKSKIKCSMTENYNPYQNAIAKRVNRILKYEFINRAAINGFELMTLLIRNSIEIYNNERPHFSC